MRARGKYWDDEYVYVAYAGSMMKQLTVLLVLTTLSFTVGLPVPKSKTDSESHDLQHAEEKRAVPPSKSGNFTG